MSGLTPADLWRHRIRLDALPGFDVLGLRVYLWPDAELGSGRLVVAAQPHRVDSLDEPWPSGAVGGTVDSPPASTWLCTSDASTRDRVARWVAGRHPKFRLGSTAPSWTSVVVTRGGHTESIGWLLSEEATASDHHFNRDLHCPDLDVNDDRLLPDGSRWVDAAALADVARHVGARP